MDILKSLICLLLILFSSKALPLNPINSVATAKNRCLPAHDNANQGKNLFHEWFLSWEQMKPLFDSSYHSPNRLPDRTYYDPIEKVFILPFPYSISQNTEKIKLTENFIINVILHIQNALNQHYADYINFSDMGHSHFLIPQDYYKKEIQSISSHNGAEQYEKMLAFEETKFIYHTAEQLKLVEEDLSLPQDLYLRHRYLTRNIIGKNDQSGELTVVQVENLKKEYNTVRRLDGHRWWSGGFYISSHHQGCFPYKKGANTYYFDISLKRNF